MIGKNDLFRKLGGYSDEDIIKIEKAYETAKCLHANQFRKSGEPYIMHPVNVAYILTQLKADADTICAGLLHDTLEDTNIKKEELSELFNPTIADLVDGVTKMRKIHFQSKREQNLANTKKILTSLITDVRIIIIKLADRLHNMRTLEFHKLEKQKEIALETMEIFVPLAGLVGSYWLKSELEDLTLLYLKPEEYQRVAEIRHKQEVGFMFLLEEMKNEIMNKLLDSGIDNKIYTKIKNIYGIYKNFQDGKNLEDMHDLLALKIIVDNINSCYITLGLVNQIYHPLNNSFKDYICVPKMNGYKSIHMTNFGKSESSDEKKLVQIRIRTYEMDNIAYNGLTAKWNLKQDGQREDMQQYFKNNYSAYDSFMEILKLCTNDRDLVLQTCSEMFSDKIYVYTPIGERVELPKGAKPIDFAYKIHSSLGNNMTGVIINGHYADFNVELRTGDVVEIKTDGLPLLFDEFEAKTARAKRKIRENNSKIGRNN